MNDNRSEKTRPKSPRRSRSMRRSVTGLRGAPAGTAVARASRTMTAERTVACAVSEDNVRCDICHGKGGWKQCRTCYTERTGMTDAKLTKETGLESTAPPKSGEEGRCPFAKCWGRIYIDATAQADMAELQGRMNAERQRISSQPRKSSGFRG